MTPTQARDELYARVTDAWTAFRGPNDEQLGPIEYKDKPVNQTLTPIPPTDPVPWMRCEMVHTYGRATTIGNHEGVKRHNRTGFFRAEVFTPIGGSMLEAEDCALLVNHALEDKRLQGEVFLRNVRMGEVGSDGHWFQTNIFCDFEYDEVR